MELAKIKTLTKKHLDSNPEHNHFLLKDIRTIVGKKYAIITETLSGKELFKLKLTKHLQSSFDNISINHWFYLIKEGNEITVQQTLSTPVPTPSLSTVVSIDLSDLDSETFPDFPNHTDEINSQNKLS